MIPHRIPLATYRLQFTPHYSFAAARDLVPYLHQLGITDLYASPVFKACQGSPHGYDVTDYTLLNPELGTEAEFHDLAHTLQQYGMGLLLDLVPNHMGIGDASNRWWQDVLENGPASPYAHFFDIDWTPPKEALIHKVLLPVLGDQYGKVLEQGDIRLLYQQGAFFIAFYHRQIPVAPRTWTSILEAVLERLQAAVETDDPHVLELESILTSLRHLPLRTETDPEKVREGQREKEVARRRLATLVQSHALVQHALEAVVAAMNGQPGEPHSFNALEALLAEQAYHLCHWRVAADEVNYRRFFDINDLAAIRIEQPDVFTAVHALVFRLMGDGLVTGLRIDHADGLFDPAQYFLDLQAGCRQALAAPGETPALPGGDDDRPCYVVVEKILVGAEQLCPHWAVYGTTGYDFLNLLNGLFVDADGQQPFEDLYSRFTGHTRSMEDVAYESKQLLLDVAMSSELHVLARHLDRLSEQHRWSRDFTLFSLQAALREVIACFPVYRTYIGTDKSCASAEDRGAIAQAVQRAKRRNPAISASLFDFLATLLLLDEPEDLDEAQRARRRNFIMRFQQLTGPVMAKGLEDTAFYRTYPLASLNEVGGDLERFGVAVEDFHQCNAERLAQWPYSLLATSTHDTKRSEDMRARLNVLSEMPQQWERAIQRWQVWNRNKKIMLNGAAVPDANEEYLLYQTLVGTWPLAAMDEAEYRGFVERLVQYMEKALKEAKRHTSWVSPHEAYDQAVRSFVRQVLTPHTRNAFLWDFVRFHTSIAYPGMCNALAQTLLKITAPGVPDFYQGTELWDFSLVDPDNRRPVDFHARMARLAALQQQAATDPVTQAQALLTHWQDGQIKLYVTSKALHFRKTHAALFLAGDYLPLDASRSRQGHILAFARQHENMWALVVVPRLLSGLVTPGKPPLGRRVWGKSLLRLPPQGPVEWHNVFTGKTHTASATASAQVLSLGDVFDTLPVALLSGTTSPGSLAERS